MQAVKTRGVLGATVIIIAARCIHLPKLVLVELSRLNNALYSCLLTVSCTQLY
jgi:hypothetical protein